MHVTFHRGIFNWRLKLGPYACQICIPTTDLQPFPRTCGLRAIGLRSNICSAELSSALVCMYDLLVLSASFLLCCQEIQYGKNTHLPFKSCLCCKYSGFRQAGFPLASAFLYATRMGWEHDLPFQSCGKDYLSHSGRLEPGG